MSYIITIIKQETNTNFEQEMADFKEKNRGYMGNDFINTPQLLKSTRSLEVVLTEEEYNAVKKSVLATFE